MWMHIIIKKYNASVLTCNQLPAFFNETNEGGLPFRPKIRIEQMVDNGSPKS